MRLQGHKHGNQKQLTCDINLNLMNVAKIKVGECKSNCKVVPEPGKARSFYQSTDSDDKKEAS